jgi:hypothetical protein
MEMPMMNFTQQKWHTKMKKEHKCFKKFITSLNAVKSQQSYGYHFQKFMRFCVQENYVSGPEEFEELLEFDSEKITDVLEDYVDFLQENNTKAISSVLSSPELFFTMNRKIWHNKLVRKGIISLDRKKGGELAITDEEIERVYQDCNTPREKCIISLIGCLGIRPGAIADPVIRFKHLIPIEDSYGIRIYDESKYGYWAIIIPEARKDIENYKQSRIRNGEKITDESPLLKTDPSKWNHMYDYVTVPTLNCIMKRLIKDKVKRTKTGNRYDKALHTMFRKRFSQKLGLTNLVNSNVAELCMGHTLPGSQHTYKQSVTLEKVYEAVKPAFEILTIDSSKRKDIALSKEKAKNEELMKSNKSVLRQLVKEEMLKEKKINIKK